MENQSQNWQVFLFEDWHHSACSIMSFHLLITPQYVNTHVLCQLQELNLAPIPTFELPPPLKAKINCIRKTSHTARGHLQTIIIIVRIHKSQFQDFSSPCIKKKKKKNPFSTLSPTRYGEKKIISIFLTFSFLLFLYSWLVSAFSLSQKGNKKKCWNLCPMQTILDTIWFRYMFAS